MSKILTLSIILRDAINAKKNSSRKLKISQQDLSEDSLLN